MLKAWAVLAVLVCGGGAWAETLTVPLVQTAEPIRHVYPGRSLVIGGLALGMTTDEVREHFSKMGFRAFERMELKPLSIQEKGVTAVAAPYLAEIGIDRPDGLTIARFGLPSTGSQVISIQHLVTFDTAKPLPTVQSLLDQLTASLGSDSAADRFTYSSDLMAFWVFDELGSRQCGPRECSVPPPYLNVSAMEASIKLLATGRHIGVTASFSSAQDPPELDLRNRLTEEMYLTLYDDDNVVLTVQNGVLQLHAAILSKLHPASPGGVRP